MAADPSDDTADFLTICPGQLSHIISTKDKVAFFGGQEKYCTFNIYLNMLKISKRCIQNVRRDLKTFSLVLSWTFCDIHDSLTIEDTGALKKVSLSHRKSYFLKLHQNFLEAFAAKPLTFELFAFKDEKTIFIGGIKCNPQISQETNHIKQDARVYFVNSKFDEKAISVAILNISYKFHFDQTVFNCLLMPMQGTIKPTENTKDAVFKLDDVDELNKVNATQSEIEIFYDGVLLVINKNKTLKTSQAEINEELTEKIQILHAEANWKKTLQENAILRAENPLEIIWRQWRTEQTHDLHLRSYYHHPPHYKPEFVINILNFAIFPEASIFSEIDQVYIEYNFLSRGGIEMESPFSYQKSQEEIVVNFLKTFPIDIKENEDICNELVTKISNSECITFVLINEPFEKVENSIQNCSEIGFAKINLHKIVNCLENMHKIKLEIYNFQDTMEIIGYISVEFDGILALRKMALLMLLPANYSLANIL